LHCPELGKRLDKYVKSPRLTFARRLIAKMKIPDAKGNEWRSKLATRMRIEAIREKEGHSAGSHKEFRENTDEEPNWRGSSQKKMARVPYCVTREQ